MEEKQVPIKKNDHFIDCLGYIIGAGCEYVENRKYTPSINMSPIMESEVFNPTEEGIFDYAT